MPAYAVMLGVDSLETNAILVLIHWRDDATGLNEGDLVRVPWVPGDSVQTTNAAVSTAIIARGLEFTPQRVITRANITRFAFDRG